MAFYYRPTYRVRRTNDDETSPTDEYVDEVDLELGVCPPIHKPRRAMKMFNKKFYVLRRQTSDPLLRSYPAKFDSKTTRSEKIDVF